MSLRPEAPGGSTAPGGQEAPGLEVNDPVTPAEQERKTRMAEVVREVITRRERAPRSPRLERALKRLLWRYTGQQGRRSGR